MHGAFFCLPHLRTKSQSLFGFFVHVHPALAENHEKNRVGMNIVEEEIFYNNKIMIFRVGCKNFRPNVKFFPGLSTFAYMHVLIYVKRERKIIIKGFYRLLKLL